MQQNGQVGWIIHLKAPQGRGVARLLSKHLHLFFYQHSTLLSHLFTSIVQHISQVECWSILMLLYSTVRGHSKGLKTLWSIFPHASAQPFFLDSPVPYFKSLHSSLKKILPALTNGDEVFCTSRGWLAGRVVPGLDIYDPTIHMSGDFDLLWQLSGRQRFCSSSYAVVGRIITCGNHQQHNTSKVPCNLN